MSTYATVIRSGGGFIGTLYLDNGALVTTELQAKYLEHAEAEALNHFVEAESVNGIARPGHIKFDEVPKDGKIPHEKARVQKPLDFDKGENGVGV